MEDKVNDSFQTSKINIVVYPECLGIFGSRLLKLFVS